MGNNNTIIIICDWSGFMVVWILAGVLLSLITLSLMAGDYFYNLSLNPCFSKDAIFNTPSQESKEDREIWFHENCTKKVSLTSFDGLSLKGYIAENTLNSTAWVIIAHGYTDSASSMCSYAQRFYEMGFNVLLPDARGHGSSQGTYIGMGWHERKDIKSWIDYINDNYPESQILLFGISMGAATVMMASGETLPINVRAVIEDCGYTSVKEEFKYQLKNCFHLPWFPILPATSIIARIKAGYSIIYEGSAIEQIKKSHIPTLFIHGTADDFVPFFMLDKLYETASCPKQYLTIEGSGHAKACSTNPELYWRTIKDFLKKYININD
jgi:fermentation-respiration switch protein FrsA (DUF1100 family)